MTALAERLWAAAGGDPAAPDRLTITGKSQILPSLYDVTGLAASATAAAVLGVTEVQAVRQGRASRVTIDTRAACAAFRSEHLLSPIGWELLPIWDAIAGDYQSADGWIRLHTNYSNHRLAVLRALGLDEARKEQEAAAVAKWSGDELETTVVSAGGAAAVSTQSHLSGPRATPSYGRPRGVTHALYRRRVIYRLSGARPGRSGGTWPASPDAEGASMTPGPLT